MWLGVLFAVVWYVFLAALVAVGIFRLANWFDARRDADVEDVEEA